MRSYIRKLEAKVVEQAKLLGMEPKTSYFAIPAKEQTLKGSSSQDGGKTAPSKPPKKLLDMKFQLPNSGRSRSRSGTTSQRFDGLKSLAGGQSKLDRALNCSEIINSQRQMLERLESE